MATAKSILGMPGFSVEDKVQLILATWEPMSRAMGSGWWNYQIYIEAINRSIKFNNIYMVVLIQSGSLTGIFLIWQDESSKKLFGC